MSDTVVRAARSSELALARAVLGFMPHIGRVTWRAAEHCGLAPERCRLLFVLGDRSLRTGALAQHLKLSPATVSELVDAMADEGLVRREADPDDRRAVVLGLTGEGRRQRQRYEQAAASELAAVLANLTPAQQRRLARAFSDIRAAFIASSQREPTLHANPRKERAHAR